MKSTRAQAANLLHAVLNERRTLDEAVAMNPPEGDAADTRFIMLLVLTVLRHVGQIDALLKKYIDKPLPAKRQQAIQALRLGIAQLLIIHTPAHAAVNETVGLVKQSKDAGLSGLVNAVLQKINREQPTLPDARHNIPNWLQLRWEPAYGKDITKAMAMVAAERPPLDLYAPAPQQFRQGERIDGTIWRLPAEHETITELEGFTDGSFWVQDIAASYPARLLGEVKGLQILDLGAAPGGKTAQLVKAGATVTALDKSATRMETLKENLKRLNMTAHTEIADIMQYEPGKQFDAVLLDAPCSATGTWRRHPEVLAVTTQHDITELAGHQRDMLQRAWHWVKPGGRLVYCVCSLEPEEGEQQADWFLKHHADAKLLPAGGNDIPTAVITEAGYLRTRPDMRMDGFFAALFQKRS